MKKVLFASTALVAAGMMMTAATASASEKIKLNVGGFSKWWVVGQFQDDTYLNAAVADYNQVDIKGDNEIFFGGSTALDNGMKVGVQVELEAGGHTETSTGGDVIDESYVWLETGFGKFIVGSENNGAYLLHVMAPDAAGNWGEGGIMTSNAAIRQPDAISAMPGGYTTAIATDGDADKITYVAPSFMGLTLGATYAPNNDEDNRGLTDLNAAGRVSDVFGVGGLYANTFGDVGLKVSAGWATYQSKVAPNSSITGDGELSEYSVGTQLAFQGFTLGGSYRQRDGYRSVRTDLQDTGDAKAWDVGVQYAAGPYAVSLAYFNAKTVGTTTVVGDDEVTFIQASGKYNLGAGVDVLASVGHAKYDDETTTRGNNNEGWTVMTGLGLSF